MRWILYLRFISVSLLIVLKICYWLAVEKLQINVFASINHYFLIWKILSVTLLRDSAAAIFDSEKKGLVQAATCEPVKLYRKPPATCKFWCIFTAAKYRSTLENINQLQ